MRRAPEAEAWKRMVLRSMPRPAWLDLDAPHHDVVLSSRARIMRNLKGHRFPHRADADELNQVLKKVLWGTKQAGLDMHMSRQISPAEREYLVGCRLVSPEFPWSEPGRALLLDERRALSIMINEEDHLRIQVLTAGWSQDAAHKLANDAERRLSRQIECAYSPDFGYLACSPFNTGEGKRLSSMFHLIGLAHQKRLPAVLKALTVKNIAARGLFGESSRAIGAFVQVSMTSGNVVEYLGACEYLMREERDARSNVGRGGVVEKAQQVKDFALRSREMSLADAMRVLAWTRWAALAEVDGFSVSPREVDYQLSIIQLPAYSDEERAARHRADALRAILE